MYMLFDIISKKTVSYISLLSFVHLTETPLWSSNFYVLFASYVARTYELGKTLIVKYEGSIT